MSDPTYDGLCGVPCLYAQRFRCKYEMGHGGDHSWKKQQTHLFIHCGVFQSDMDRWFHPMPKNCRCTPLRDVDSREIVEYIFDPDCPAHDKIRYTAESVRKALEPERERLFALYAADRPPGWSCDLRTKDMHSIYGWIVEELVRLKVNEDDRRTQQAFYNRWCRSDEDLFDLAARTMNAVLEGQVQQHRIPHHRWG